MNNFICLDFETYFDDQYTLSKMTTEAYIRDDRFSAHLVGIVGVMDGAKVRMWVTGNESGLAEYLKRIDWAKTTVLCHHAAFDGLILSHHYGVHPHRFLDTYSMGRLMHGNKLGQSLASLAAHYGLGVKTVPYELFKGRQWINIEPEHKKMLGEGCLQDCDLTIKLFQNLNKDFPTEELDVVDYTVKMFTNPCVVGDVKLLRDIQFSEWLKKEDSITALGVDKTELASAAKFSALLAAEGVEVEQKTTSKSIVPAVAKTDPFMQSLADHANPRVAALAEARLSIKSTINETRAARLADCAERGLMPVYLHYAGAHTSRWSGGDKVNYQNFGREAELKKGLRAPKGYVFAQVDKSQIECRILNYLAGQTEVIERFRTGADPYIGIASKFYGREITKADKKERNFGKVLELQCGYGSGAAVIQRSARLSAVPIELTDAEALAARDLYRSEHQGVVNLWKAGDKMLHVLAGEISHMLWENVVRVKKGTMILPNGIPLWYDVHYDAFERKWKRKTRRGEVGIWGGHLVENLVQALSRVDVSQSVLRIKKQTGLMPVVLTHDDGRWLIPDNSEKQATLTYLIEEMSVAPTWLAGIPLAAEGNLSEHF